MRLIFMFQKHKSVTRGVNLDKFSNTYLKSSLFTRKVGASHLIYMSIAYTYKYVMEKIWRNQQIR